MKLLEHHPVPRSVLYDKALEARNYSRETTGTYNGFDVAGFFVLVWFLDEWLGHTLVMVSLFGFFAVATVAEYLAGVLPSGKWGGSGGGAFLA